MCYPLVSGLKCYSEVLSKESRHMVNRGCFEQQFSNQQFFLVRGWKFGLLTWPKSMVIYQWHFGRFLKHKSGNNATLKKISKNHAPLYFSPDMHTVQKNMQPRPNFNLNQHSEYTAATFQKYIFILGCLEENIDYGGGNVNGGTDTKHDAEGCQTFCKINHPEALYFSWVSKNYGTTSLHSRCFCKSGKEGRTPNNGITSGPVNCPEGKRYYIC